MLKLAILDADILYDSLLPRYQCYGKMFKDLLSDVKANWEVEVFSVIEGHYPSDMDQYDAFLLTGSKADSFADTPWIVRLRDFVAQLYQHRKPMVGICFGHQILAHALGGEAGRSDAGWGLGVMQYQVVGKLPYIDGHDDVALIVSHQDQVLALPPGAETILSNDFCRFAAFQIPRNVLAIQGHPEFSVAYANDLLTVREHRLPDRVVKQARQSLSTLTPQGARVAKWMKAFVEDAVSSRHLFTTDRLLCRRWLQQDKPALLSVYGDLQTVRWVGDGSPLTDEEAEYWFAVTERNYQQRGYGMFTLESREDGKVVGFAGIVHPNNQQEPEIKYALHRDYWAQGLGSELVAGLIVYARIKHGLSVLIATVDPDNQASRRILEKSGMQHEDIIDDENGRKTLIYRLRG
jgi:GMP synthase (glutamine-hydrolysing)